MKAVEAAFNQENALAGAFSVIVQLHRLIVYSTNCVSLCLPSATAAAAAAMTVAWCLDTGENTGTGNSVYLMFITNNHASQTFFCLKSSLKWITELYVSFGGKGDVVYFSPTDYVLYFYEGRPIS